MEKMTVICIIICVVHFVSVVAAFIAEDEGSIVTYKIGKFFFYFMSLLAIDLMIYFQYNHLPIKPIVILATYMIIPGFITLLGNLFAFDRAENTLLPGTFITVATTIASVVTFTMLG